MFFEQQTSSTSTNFLHPSISPLQPLLSTHSTNHSPSSASTTSSVNQSSIQTPTTVNDEQFLTCLENGDLSMLKNLVSDFKTVTNTSFDVNSMKFVSYKIFLSVLIFFFFFLMLALSLFLSLFRHILYRQMDVLS